jgi:hypothetical protein
MNDPVVSEDGTYASLVDWKVEKVRGNEVTWVWRRAK